MHSSSSPGAQDDEMIVYPTPQGMLRQSSFEFYGKKMTSPTMSMRSESVASSLGYEERYTTPLIKSKNSHTLRSCDDGTQSLCEFTVRPSITAMPMLEEVVRPTLSYDTNRYQKGVMTTGILYRRRRGNIAWIERWTLSHFVLTTHSLKYYSHNGDKLLGELDLSGCTEKSIEIMPKDSVPNGRQATIWRFALRTPQRRIILSAATEYEMNCWLRHLKAVVNSKAKQTNDTRFHRADSEIPLCDFNYDDEIDPIESYRSHSVSLRNFSLNASRV